MICISVRLLSQATATHQSNARNKLPYQELAGREIETAAIELALLTALPSFQIGFHMLIPLKWSHCVDAESEHSAVHLFSKAKLSHVWIDRSKALFHVLLPSRELRVITFLPASRSLSHLCDDDALLEQIGLPFHEIHT